MCILELTVMVELKYNGSDSLLRKARKLYHWGHQANFRFSNIAKAFKSCLTFMNAPETGDIKLAITEHPRIGKGCYATCSLVGVRVRSRLRKAAHLLT